MSVVNSVAVVIPVAVVAVLSEVLLARLAFSASSPRPLSERPQSWKKCLVLTITMSFIFKLYFKLI